MTDPIHLDGQSLTLEQVIAVANGAPGSPRIELTLAAHERVDRAAEAVQQLIQRGAVAYGITTGFGAFKDRIIPPDEVQTLQRNILLSHAVGVGEPFDVPTTRAIMLIRLNTLARGHSGIRFSTLQMLQELLNRGVHPLIPCKGSLGASGDLAPLAHMACVLIGEGEARLPDGSPAPAEEVLAMAGLQPLRLVAKEGLALTNGTAVMCALGALNVYRALHLGQLADIAGALSLEALHGTDLAFDERIQRLRPHPQQSNCAAYLRDLLAGSDLTRHDDPSNVQDAYTLRCIPQVHGAARDAIAYARWVIDLELNAVTDNPLLFLDDATGEISVLSGGNFHGEPLAIAMDYLAIALAELGNISERRIMRLTDEASNAHVLPAFLTEQGGLNSGFMLTQYTAAALASENKSLAHPASVDTIPSSANVEDHVSMGLTAAQHVAAILDNVEHILSIELLCAAQGIDFRRRAISAQAGPKAGDPAPVGLDRGFPPVGARLGKGTDPVYRLIRQRVPFLEKDALMYPYMRAVHELAASRQIVSAADTEVCCSWSMSPVMPP
jgi:histidine ammonia-lyase